MQKIKNKKASFIFLTEEEKIENREMTPLERGMRGFDQSGLTPKNTGRLQQIYKWLLSYPQVKDIEICIKEWEANVTKQGIELAAAVFAFKIAGINPISVSKIRLVTKISIGVCHRYSSMRIFETVKLTEIPSRTTLKRYRFQFVKEFYAELSTILHRRKEFGKICQTQ